MANLKTPEERQKNKENLALAVEIRSDKERDLKTKKHGKSSPVKQKINFLDYYQSYINSYTKKDIRMMEGSLQRLFLTIQKSNQTPDGNTQLDVKLEGEAVWINRQQMAKLFDRDVKTIGKHINNALKEELSEIPVVAKFATTATRALGQKYNLPRNVKYFFRFFPNFVF